MINEIIEAEYNYFTMFGCMPKFLILGSTDYLRLKLEAEEYMKYETREQDIEGRELVKFRGLIVIKDLQNPDVPFRFGDLP